MSEQLKQGHHISLIALLWQVQIVNRKIRISSDRFAKTASSCDSVDSIFTHVYPFLLLAQYDSTLIVKAHILHKVTHVITWVESYHFLSVSFLRFASSQDWRVKGL